MRDDTEAVEFFNLLDESVSAHWNVARSPDRAIWSGLIGSSYIPGLFHLCWTVATSWGRNDAGKDPAAHWRNSVHPPAFRIVCFHRLHYLLHRRYSHIPSPKMPRYQLISAILLIDIIESIVNCKIHIDFMSCVPLLQMNASEMNLNWICCEGYSLYSVVVVQNFVNAANSVTLVHVKWMNKQWWFSVHNDLRNLLLNSNLQLYTSRHGSTLFNPIQCFHVCCTRPLKS